MPITTQTSNSASPTIPINLEKPSDLDSCSWDELTKEAKHLENELDSKLLTLGRLTSAALRAQRYDTFRPPSTGTDSPLYRAEMVANELQRGLERLGGIVEVLTVRTEEAGSSLHILQRHRDLYLEYSKDFRKTKEHLQSAKEHAQLIHSVREEITAHRKGASMGSDPQTLLLAEQNRIGTARSATDHLIEY